MTAPRRTEKLRRLLGREEAEQVADAALRAGAISPARREELDAAANGPEAVELLAAGGVSRDLAASFLHGIRREEAERARRSRVAPPPPEVTAAASDPARRVDDFVLVEALGRGGGGEVWKAWDLGLARWVALKRPAPGAEGRFLEEALAAARLSHPNIVPIHRVGGDAERPWFAMGLVSGRTLEGLKLEPRRAAEILRKVALAVAAAHAAGIVHRDLKPANVMLDEGDEPRILDFGIAGWSGRAGPAGVVSGTPGYMAPEQRRGGPESERPAVDVYALGAILRAVGPPALSAVADRAMAEDPARRTPSASEFAADLGRFLAAPTSRAPAWIVAVGLVLAVLAGYALLRTSEALGPSLARLADRSLAARRAGLSGEFERLGEEGKRLAAGHPDGPAKDLELSRFHRVRGEIDEAWSRIGRHPGSDPRIALERDLVERLVSGRERRIRGGPGPEDAGRAAEAAREGLDRDPSDRELRLALAEALAADGDLPTAELEASRAVDAKPGAPDARMVRARIRFAIGAEEAWKGAEADLEEAAKALPAEPAVRRLLAETRCAWASSLSRAGKATGDLFDRALAVAADPVLEGAILAARGDHRIRVGEDPEPDYAAAEARLASSGSPEAARHLAGIRYNRGDRVSLRGEDPSPHYAAAIADYGRAIGHRPGDAELRLLRGCVHWNFGVRLRKDDAARAREQFGLAASDFEEAVKSPAFAERAGEFLRNARRELER